MKPAGRKRLRRLWFASLAGVSMLAIALAVLMALGQLLLPLAAHYPQRVAALISAKLDQPVRFKSMQGYWQASGPMLVLHGVEIGSRDGKPALTVPSAVVKLDFGALLWPSRHWVNLRLSDLKLQLSRDMQGQWHVVGFGSSEPVNLSDLPGNLWLDNLKVQVRDQRAGRSYGFQVQTLRVSNNGGVLRFAGRVQRGKPPSVMRVAGQVSQGGANGRLYLATTQADLGALFDGIGVGDELVQGGHGDLQLWLDWQQRAVVGLTLDAGLEQLVLQGPGGHTTIASLHGLMRYARQGEHTTLWLAPDGQGAARVDTTGSGSSLHVDARAHDFDTSGWLALTQWAPGLPDSLARWLATAQPQVHLADAQMRWSRQLGLQHLQAHFDHLTMAATDTAPGVSSLHGVVLGDAQAVAIYMPKQTASLDVAHVFRHPFVFTEVDGNLVLWKSDDAWSVATDALNVTGKGLSAQLRGRVLLPAAGGAPTLRVFANIQHGDMAEAPQFWPVNVIPSKAVEWMDRALNHGTIEHAQALMFGDMADWPFDQHQGHFQADVRVAGMTMDYHPDWPKARGVNATARFINKGLLVEADAGYVREVPIKRMVGSIADFTTAELVLHVEGSSKGNPLLDFLRHSPIGRKQAKDLAGLSLGGKTDYRFSTVIPIAKDAPDAFVLGGQVDLHDGVLTNPDWGLHLAGLNGALAFDADGFHGRALAARFRGQPVQLDMDVGGTAEHPTWPVQARMQGRFSMQQLARERPQLARLADAAKGSSVFEIGFHVDESKSNPVHAKQVLEVRSNLQGMALDLPAPLGKTTQALLPLNLQLGLPFAGQRLRLILGNRLYARARLPAPGKSGSVDVQLGGGAPQGSLPAHGIRIRGSVPKLDLSGWVQYALAASDGAASDAALLDVDVKSASTDVFGSRFSDLRFKLVPDPGQWKLVIEGPAMQGSMTVPLKNIDQRGIVARYQRLYWPSPAQQPLQPATEGEQLATTTEASGLPTFGVAPSSLPPLHLWVADLRLGDAHLGQARLESWPTAKGMHIDMLRTQSDSVHMSASGDWNGNAQASHTHLIINFSAENLGHMLDAFGYEGVIMGGTTQVHMDARWLGAPSAFALAKLVGTMQVKIGSGRIPEVKPGVGRLFGLMSIVELPRRLTMDFGSMFGKGFGFDSIEGNFRFEDGNAWTHDLVIKGPSADIIVAGRVDLRQHLYDQYVLAMPHIGNSLPIVGAVLAGPVGAAAGLAIQGLLGKGLNKVASARYHITGPWDKPVVTLLEKHIPKDAGIPVSAATAVRVVPAPVSSVVPAPAASVPTTR